MYKVDCISVGCLTRLVVRHIYKLVLSGTLCNHAPVYMVGLTFEVLLVHSIGVNPPSPIHSARLYPAWGLFLADADQYIGAPDSGGDLLLPRSSGWKPIIAPTSNHRGIIHKHNTVWYPHTLLSVIPSHSSQCDNLAIFSVWYPRTLHSVIPSHSSQCDTFTLHSVIPSHSSQCDTLALFTVWYRHTPPYDTLHSEISQHSTMWYPHTLHSVIPSHSSQCDTTTFSTVWYHNTLHNEIHQHSPQCDTITLHKLCQRFGCHLYLSVVLLVSVERIRRTTGYRIGRTRKPK